MIIIDNKKYACASCIRGHRTKSCNHTSRELIEIKKKGRPVSQCPHCRKLRKEKKIHVRCNFSKKDIETTSASIKPIFTGELREHKSTNSTNKPSLSKNLYSSSNDLLSRKILENAPVENPKKRRSESLESSLTETFDFIDQNLSQNTTKNQDLPRFKDFLHAVENPSNEPFHIMPDIAYKKKPKFAENVIPPESIYVPNCCVDAIEKDKNSLSNGIDTQMSCKPKNDEDCIPETKTNELSSDDIMNGIFGQMDEIIKVSACELKEVSCHAKNPGSPHQDSSKKELENGNCSSLCKKSTNNDGDNFRGSNEHGTSGCCSKESGSDGCCSKGSGSDGCCSKGSGSDGCCSKGSGSDGCCSKESGSGGCSSSGGDSGGCSSGNCGCSSSTKNKTKTTFKDSDGAFHCGCGCKKPLRECTDCLDDFCEEIIFRPEL
ncbi:hypothetical protein BB558_002472 [Smittium angustum]|uniref:Copper-fist domain-containing protein n=1 Tax=Smittium angustum TaxID=133377 RepID=A0A2U1J2U5_SMIAN|nr:hypothetical protein BB558_004645 [Smittium angustum]PWA01423.1 hypothetical protein BB558_002472 [Smittium angustum]